MGGIVDDAKAVFVGYLLYGFGVTGFAVTVDGHDAGGGGGDGGLYLRRVHIAGGGVNINEHGFAAVPPDAVGGGHEAVGCGDDFAGDAQGLEGGHQRECAVGEEAHVGDMEVIGKGLFEALMVLAHVGDPLTLPDVLEQFVELAEVWQ